MLITLLYWFYVALVSTVTGLALVLRVMRLTSVQPNTAWQVPLPFYSFGGLAFYGVLANALSLVTPLSGWVHGLPLVLSLLAVGAEPTAMRQGWQRVRDALAQWRWPEWGLLGISVLAALFLSALPSQITDDGVYYQQYIRWLKEYPVIPGLAQLNARFGFNSSWHSLEAFFNLAYFGGLRFELTGMLQALLAVLAARGLVALRQGRAGLDHYTAVAALPLSVFLTKMLTAPAMDAAVAFFALALLLLYLQRWRLGAWGARHPLSLLLMGITLFALTLKLSALALAGFLIAMLLEQKNPNQRLRFWLPFGLLFLGVFLPWLMRFYFLSGYLVFPLHEVDLFSPDWKLPSAMVAEERMYIRGFARVKHLPYPQALSLSLAEWLPRWFQELWGMGRLLMLAGTGSLVAYLLLFVFRAIGGRFTGWWRSLSVPILVALGGVLYWFVSAPALRFGYAYLFIPLALAGGQILQYGLARSKTFKPWWAMLAAVAIASLLVERSINEAQGAQWAPSHWQWFQPAAPERVRMINTQTKGPFMIKQPQGAEPCRDGPLPCVPFLPGDVKLRDSALSDGFYNPQFNRYRYRRRLIERFQDGT